MLCFILGTRPEYIKLSPIWENLPDESYRVLFTGQHDHRDFMKKPLANNMYAYEYNPFARSLAETQHYLQENITSYLGREIYTGVVVQGDTASAFAGALVAFQLELPIYHIEAGLRTYDLASPFPEEGYRQMISRIASVHFCPTQPNFTNILAEPSNRSTSAVRKTGNPGLPTSSEKVEHGPKVLVTMHRRENFPLLPDWFVTINKIASLHPEFEFIIPLHHNPNVQKHRELLTNLKVIDPLPHEELISLLRECSFVISDSGGIQEECTYYNKRCFVCRTITERPEGCVSGHLLLCSTPGHLLELWEKQHKNPDFPFGPCPFYQKDSAKNIAQILIELDNPTAIK